MPRRRMPDVTFGLVKVLKPEMRAKLKRAWTQRQLNCSFTDVGDRGPAGKAKAGDGDLDGLKDRGGFSGCESVIGEQLQARLIELDPVLLNLCQQREPVHAADAHGPGHVRVVTVGRAYLSGWGHANSALASE